MTNMALNRKPGETERLTGITPNAGFCLVRLLLKKRSVGSKLSRIKLTRKLTEK